MASDLACRASSIARNRTLWNHSLSSFVRSFSTSSPAASANPAAPSSPTKRRKKGKNLFEVAQFLPNWGLGFHMAKNHWTNVSYEITKINLYKDGRHGKAWGIAFKDGLPAAEPKKISGVHKRCWKYIKNVKKSQESTPKPLVVEEGASLLEG